MSTLKYNARTLSLCIRRHVLQMVALANASHAGSCLSAADILAVLYGGILNVSPATVLSPERDRFVMSKGHAAAAVYAVLAECGFIPIAWLSQYCADGGVLAGHVTAKGIPGIEASTGSLGHGLSMGCGMALAGMRGRQRYRVFVLLSDGECNEGAVWEAAMFAAHHRLSNLVAIVDYNQLQGFGRTHDVLELEPFAQKWTAFGWTAREVDGHCHDDLARLLQVSPSIDDRPNVVIAHTTKGKGVSYMEDELAWHYRTPTPEQLAQALSELGGTP